MSYSGNTYGSLSPRVGIIAKAEFLAYAELQLCLEKFGKADSVPKNGGLTIKWRRPVPFDPAVNELVEGVTPPAHIFEYEDVTARIAQYGSWVALTDVIQDTHEDPVLKHMTEMCGRQAGETKEAITWNVLTGGTNVFYSGVATTRATVNAPLDVDDIDKIIRNLEKNFAKKVAKMVAPTDKVATQPIRPGYIYFGHTDQRQDFENADSFVPLENYSSQAAVSDYEIGSIKGMRVILTPHYRPLLGAGNTGGTGVLETGSNADVYQGVIIAEEAYACTVLKGMQSAAISVKNPKMGESYEDPLGQRGFVSWKFWYVVVRLNESWMARLEAACSSL